MRQLKRAHYDCKAENGIFSSGCEVEDWQDTECELSQDGLRDAMRRDPLWLNCHSL
jgi:hypothetical protein